MYRISMKKNDGHGLMWCFFSLAWFSPGKVIIRLEKRTNGKFKTVGYISPHIFKIVDLTIKKAPFYENKKDKYLDVSRFLKTTSIDIVNDHISVEEDKIGFLESSIVSMNDEVRFFKELMAKQKAVMRGLGKTKLKFPTWKEYSAAIKA